MRARSLGSRLRSAIRPVLTSIFSRFGSRGRIRPQVESLEERRLLSTLSYAGDDSSNAWYLCVSPTDATHLQLFDHSTPTGEAIYDGLRREIDELIISGNGGNDTLIVDFSSGVPIRTNVLSFDGGAGSDSIQIIGNPLYSGTYDPTAFGSGSATIFRKKLAFSGIEAISAQDLKAFTLATDDADDHITIDKPEAGQTRFRDSTATPAFAPLTIGSVDKAVLDSSASNGSSCDQIILQDTGLSSSQNLIIAAGTAAAGQNNTLTVTGGVTNFHAGWGMSGGRLAVTVENSAVLNFAATQYLASLTLEDSAAAKLPTGLFKVLVVDALAIPSTSATLDVGDNDLILHNAAVGTIQSLIQRGYNGGNWQGSGITSSAAAASPASYDALGVMQNQSYSTFDGQTVATADVLVKYVYAGDADLSGLLDGSDYFQIDRGYLNRLSGWFNGDFDYSGTIDGSDYFLIDRSDLIQNARPKPPMSIPATASVDEGTEYTLSLQAPLTYTVQEVVDYDANGNEIYGPVEYAYDPISYWTVDWGDGVVEAWPTNGQADTSATHTYADDGSYTLSVSAKGSLLNYWVGTQSVQVNEVAPDLGVAGEDHAHEGEEYTLSFSPYERGDDEITLWTVNWGDGTPIETYPGDIEAVQHTYLGPSTGIAITATDEDGSYQTTRTLDVVPVPVPSNVTAAVVPDSLEEAVIAWDPPAGPVDAFYIWVSTDGGDYQEFDYVSGSQTSYRFFSASGGMHCFHVVAGNGPASSPPTTAIDRGTGLPAQLLIAPSIVPPPTEFGLSVPDAQVYIDAVPLVWQRSYGASGYIIEWSDDGSEWFAIDEVEAGGDTGQEQYTDEYPALGAQSYRIVAYRGNLEPVYSQPTSPLSVHPIAPPVAWCDDNQGVNDRGTLTPEYHIIQHAYDGQTPLTIYVGDLLGNDKDYDPAYADDPLCIADYDPGSAEGGTVSTDAWGNFLYSPPQGFVGTDTFTYTVADRDGHVSAPATSTARATVAIDVTNAAPQANDAECAFTDENWYSEVEWNGVTYTNALKSTLSGQDPDDKTLRYEIIEFPTHGNVTLDEDTGEFVYSLNSNFNGIDLFTFAVRDGFTQSAPASVVISGDFAMVRPNRICPDRSGPIQCYLYAPSWTVLSLPENGSVVLSYGEPLVVGEIYQGSVLIYYTPGDSFTGNDAMMLALKAGDLEGKPFQVTFHLGDEYIWDEDPGSKFHVSNAEPTDYSGDRTGFRPPLSLKSICLSQQATHGTVQLNVVDGSFKYTPNPDPATGEPYLGWDFFSYTVTQPDLPEREAWVQLCVGDYAPPSVTVEPLPLLIAATPGQIDTTVEALESGYLTAKDMLGSMLTQLSQLGQGVGQVGDAADLEILDKLDTATTNIDSIATQYDQYINQLVKLNKAAGKFLAAQWYVSQRDSDAVTNINKLPFKVGALSASNEQMKKLADSLASLGEGAGIAVDTQKKIVTTAEITHKVLTTVEMAGGATVLVKTGATLLVKEGIKACAKQAAKELMQQAASAVATQMAGYAADLVGIPPEYRQYIQLGVDAYQAFAFLKAARTKVDWNGNCFAAGTKVIVGVNEDGSVVTRSIEEIEIGDVVLSRDQYDAGDDLDPHPVTQVFRRTSDHLRILSIEGDDGNIETIRTTDTHPFYVQNKGWVSASALSLGDLVQETDGTWQAVLGSERQAFAGGITVYNIEVEGDHTYFVEDGFGPADAVWVHNACDENGDWIGSLYGNAKTFLGVKVKNKRFTVRTEETYRPLRTEFDADRVGGPKDTFLKDLGSRAATDKAVRQKLMKAGLTPTQISDMARGVRPTGFQVHHKHPLKLGGTNDQDNLMLIAAKEEGVLHVNYHAPVTTAQQRLETEHATRGEVFEAEWPDFTGFVYP